jgi:hypothetical protein
MCTVLQSLLLDPAPKAPVCQYNDSQSPENGSKDRSRNGVPQTLDNARHNCDDGVAFCLLNDTFQSDVDKEYTGSIPLF